MRTIGELYDSHIYGDIEFPESKYFYGDLPKTFQEIITRVKTSPKLDTDTTKTEKLKTILKDYHKKLGLLTQKVEENIDCLHQGVIMGGQQTTIFGGSSIIGNKIATVVALSDISKEDGNYLVPLFLVNTHDGIQPEITTTHFPNNQSSISKPIFLPDALEGQVVNRIKTNNYDWIDESLDIIGNIFSEFKSSIDKTEHKLFAERVDHILTFLRETYRTSEDIGEWITLIWGIQANIINDWGVIFFPSSHPEIRKLTLEGYLPFLTQRKKYIEEFNKASDKITELGFKPTTAKKQEDYAPFFYECPNDGYRLILYCTEEENELKFRGRCPQEKKDYFFTLNKENLSLEEHEKYLIPRLDTNQALLQTIMPVYIRVSGPGEINYNAQVIPSTRSIGIQFPLYVKYTRILYNTPWIEKLSKEIQPENLSLFTQEFFQVLGAISKARRKNEKESLKESARKLIAQITEKINQVSEYHDKKNSQIEKYKSWQFGMYDDNHKWQEVSWSWIVMASVTGLADYLAAYRRYYSKESPAGGIGYINSRL